VSEELCRCSRCNTWHVYGVATDLDAIVTERCRPLVEALERIAEVDEPNRLVIARAALAAHRAQSEAT